MGHINFELFTVTYRLLHIIYMQLICNNMQINWCHTWLMTGSMQAIHESVLSSLLWIIQIQIPKSLLLPINTVFDHNTCAVYQLCRSLLFIYAWVILNKIPTDDHSFLTFVMRKLFWKQKMICIFYHFSALRWHKSLKSFLVADMYPFIVHSQYCGCWWPVAPFTNMV